MVALVWVQLLSNDRKISPGTNIYQDVACLSDILLGTSGWSYDEWVGPFYKSKQESKLRYYSSVFNVAEIDSTFYAYPSRGLVWGWVKSTKPGFTFAAKIPQIITHEKKLDLKLGVEQDLLRFLEVMAPLHNTGKLASLLLQLPPSFKADLSIVENFFKILPKDHSFSIEPRHLSWMNSRVWKLLEDYNVAYTIVDEPLLPPEVHVTADVAYMRWHGRGTRPWYNYRYTEEELKPWIAKVKDVSGSAKRVYGFFNNHFHGYAVENCLSILEMLGDLTSEQAEAKRRIDDYRRGAPTERGQQDLAQFTSQGETQTRVEGLLATLTDRSRLVNAKKVIDQEVTLEELTETHIKASVRTYRVVIDGMKHTIQHDCADWSRQSIAKRFCKHVVKVFLMLPETSANRMLMKICQELDSWSFEQL